MPKRVRRKSNTTNSQLLPEYLEIPFKVPNGDLCIVLRTKQKTTDTHGWYPTALDLEYRSEKHLAQLARKGYQTLLTTFASDFENKVVKVYIVLRKSKHLARPKSGIKNREGNKPSPKYIYSPSGYRIKPLVPRLLEAQKAANLLARKRRK